MVFSVKRSRDPSLASEANGQLQLLLRPRLLIIVHYHEKCFEQVFLRNRLFLYFIFSARENYRGKQCYAQRFFICCQIFHCTKIERRNMKHESHAFY